MPFYLRTGKRLARKVTEIAVTLKPVPHLAFSQDGSLGVQPNQLVLTLQPNEGVSLRLGAKIPGTRMIIRPVNMEFLYGTAFLSQSPEAYERLITDAMRGDATLFTRNDEVEAQWRICDPIVKAWAADTGAAAAIRRRLAGPERGRAAAARGRSLARDLMAAGDARRLAATRSGASRARRPDAIEAALRELLVQVHAEHRRVRAGAGAQHDRVRRPRVERRDRQPPARRRALPRLAPAGARLRAAARAPRRARDRSSPKAPPHPASLALLRETVVVELGDRHLDDLLTIADPLVVTDLPTLLWSPHGHHEIVAELLALAQAVLLDSVEEPVAAEALDARVRAERARLRRRPGVAALDAVARAPRGDASTRRGCALSCT